MSGGKNIAFPVQNVTGTFEKRTPGSIYSGLYSCRPGKYEIFEMKPCIILLLLVGVNLREYMKTS